MFPPAPNSTWTPSASLVAVTSTLEKSRSWARPAGRGRVRAATARHVGIGRMWFLLIDTRAVGDIIARRETRVRARCGPRRASDRWTAGPRDAAHIFLRADSTRGFRSGPIDQTGQVIPFGNGGRS